MLSISSCWLSGEYKGFAYFPVLFGLNINRTRLWKWKKRFLLYAQWGKHAVYISTSLKNMLSPCLFPTSVMFIDQQSCSTWIIFVLLGLSALFYLKFIVHRSYLYLLPSIYGNKLAWGNRGCEKTLNRILRFRIFQRSKINILRPLFIDKRIPGNTYFWNNFHEVSNYRRK